MEGDLKDKVIRFKNGSLRNLKRLVMMSQGHPGYPFQIEKIKKGGAQ
jgi:hypothetical protein